MEEDSIESEFDAAERFLQELAGDTISPTPIPTTLETSSPPLDLNMFVGKALSFCSLWDPAMLQAELYYSKKTSFIIHNVVEQGTNHYRVTGCVCFNILDLRSWKGYVINRQIASILVIDENIQIISITKEIFLSIITDYSDVFVDYSGKILENLLEPTRNVLQFQEEERIRLIRQAEERKLLAEKQIEDRLTELRRICDEIYPNQSEVVKLRKGESSAMSSVYRATIHFPEITLTNSEQRSHTITDMYVSFYFNDKVEHISSWKGARGTFTLAELNSSYTHSHLNAGFRGYSNFCLGGTTEATRISGSLIVDKWNPTLFRTALIFIYGYLAWESLEGGPYHRICNITSSNSGNTSNLPRTPSAETIKEVASRVIKNKGYNINLTGEKQTARFKIKDDAKFEENLKQFIPDQLVFKTENGAFLPRTSNASAIEERINSVNDESLNNPLSKKIIFKDNIIIPTCIKEEKPKEQGILVVYPVVKNLISNEIEENLNNYYLKNMEYELSK